MDNPEYTFQILEVYSKSKPREIPSELEEYISYVARTGDPVFQWSLVKVLIKQKFLSVLDDFCEGNPHIEIPPCPNVDSFNYDVMKEELVSRIDNFMIPPFTIQRICELLSTPRKEYSRVDKYMRAVEKNVLVVSSHDLTLKSSQDSASENSDSAVINGIFYDKVEDSLDNISNNEFPSAEDNEESTVNSQLDETDTVQQMIQDSWNEGSESEFKIDGASSTLNDYDLDFVTGKSNDDTSNTSCEKSEDESFGNSSSLENIIDESSAESSEIAFKDESIPEESFPAKSDDTYEFKDDSLDEKQEPDSNFASFEVKNEVVVAAEPEHPILDENRLTRLHQSIDNTVESAIKSGKSADERPELPSKQCEFTFLNANSIDGVSAESVAATLTSEDICLSTMGKEEEIVESTTNDCLIPEIMPKTLEGEKIEISSSEAAPCAQAIPATECNLIKEGVSLSSGDNKTLEEDENQVPSSSDCEREGAVVDNTSEK